MAENNHWTPRQKRVFASIGALAGLFVLFYIVMIIHFFIVLDDANDLARKIPLGITKAAVISRMGEPTAEVKGILGPTVAPYQVLYYKMDYISSNFMRLFGFDGPFICVDIDSSGHVSAAYGIFN